MIELINPKEFARVLREKTRQAILDYTELEMIPRPDNENIKLLTRPAFFRGLLNYISIRIFCPPGKQSEMKNAEPWQLLAAWREYCDLCANFGHAPILELFCNCIGINSQNIRRWSAGSRRIYSSSENNDNNPDYKECANIILSEIKGIYKDKIVNENNYNTVFLLKNEYNYSDNNVITIAAKETESPAEIVKKHTGLLSVNDND